MSKPAVVSKLAFGVFVITASVFSTGCASTANSTVAVYDLENFQINCRIKEQQIKFLQSLRTNRDTQFVANIENTIKPWTMITDYPQYRQRASIANGYTNWNINQLLLRLGYDCP